MSLRPVTVLKAAAALTSAYTGWESAFIDVGTARTLNLLLTVVKADATSVEFQVEVDGTGGSTGYKLTRVSSGTATLAPVTILASGLAATDTIQLSVLVADVGTVKLSAKITGGVGAPTLAAAYILGQ